MRNNMQKLAICHKQRCIISQSLVPVIILAQLPLLIKICPFLLARALWRLLGVSSVCTVSGALSWDQTPTSWGHLGLIWHSMQPLCYYRISEAGSGWGKIKGGEILQQPSRTRCPCPPGGHNPSARSKTYST